jgi:hypothetical protein
MPKVSEKERIQALEAKLKQLRRFSSSAKRRGRGRWRGAGRGGRSCGGRFWWEPSSLPKLMWQFG